MTENTTKITEIHRENEKQRGWANNEMIKKRSWKACDWWNSFLHHTWKEFWIAPGELEESGKILEKDLWVRAHLRENTVEKDDE